MPSRLPPYASLQLSPWRRDLALCESGQGRIAVGNDTAAFSVATGTVPRPVVSKWLAANPGKAAVSPVERPGRADRASRRGLVMPGLSSGWLDGTGEAGRSAEAMTAGRLNPAESARARKSVLFVH